MNRERLTALLDSLSISPGLEHELRAMLGETFGELPVTAARPDPELVLPPRYEDRGRLGLGGMGEVRRAWDTVLEREVALKVVRAQVGRDPEAEARFAAEARATAALAHPGIVPVYDFGTVPDGRPYFTMEIVRGVTFGDRIAALHAEPGDRRFGFRRLIDDLWRAAEAVGYAHARGVVHRDLKPANLLVGEHGEVRVVDWGLFRADTRWDGPPALVAAVAGTPAYMAPEQARGEVDRIDARSDVWALGIILWEIAAGHPPTEGLGLRAVLHQLTTGWEPGPPPARMTFPEEVGRLVADCLRADPEARPATAWVVAERLRRWLDGETRRDQVRATLAAARSQALEVEPLRTAAAAARAHADQLLAATHTWEPDTSREAWWAADDAATAAERAWRDADRGVDESVEAALTLDPDDIDVRAFAAERAREAHGRAEREGRADAAVAAERRLRGHAHALPDGHPVRERVVRWLDGHGALTLVTEPPGAVAVLHRYEVVRRRWVSVPDRVLGQTPLVEVSVPSGHWLVTLEHPGRPLVRYPISIGRGEHWRGVRPGGTEPHPIALPSALDPDEVYVPAGWARLGGDPEAVSGLPAVEVWVDGFVIGRFPVRNSEYVAFVNALVDRGDVAAAERYAPRDRGPSPTSWGSVLYARDGVRFTLGVDREGEAWQPDWPVFMIDHVAAWAFARWRAETTGQPWRLVGEHEWEKAARGVDGRPYVWGDRVDPAWCANRLAFRGAPRVEPVGQRAADCSVYGVRDLAGNVVELTADRMSQLGSTPSGGIVVVPDGSADGEEAWAGHAHRICGRGGSIGHDLKAVRAAFRVGCDPWGHSTNVGFRLARPVE